ncbi:hypothetical protein AALB52_15570 [Lachnospiraceae bacterium 38-14]|nr:hypothetical protein [Lachnospiraceae bacterium]
MPDFIAGDALIEVLKADNKKHGEALEKYGEEMIRLLKKEGVESNGV